MASFPECDFQLCPLCNEMCVSSAPISSSSSSSSSSQASSSGSGGSGGSSSSLGSAPRRLHVLPCLHAFCRQCLEGHRGAGDSLHCPVCDHKVLMSEAGMDALPSSSTFLHLSSLLDAVVGAAEEPQSNGSRAGGSGGSRRQQRARSASCSSSGLLRRAAPSQAEPRCNSCDEGNGASSHCLDCQENLCDNCLRAHQRVRLTKDHFIERFPASRAPGGPSGAASPCGSAASSAATTSSSSTSSPFQGSSAFSLLPVYQERLNYCQQHDEEMEISDSNETCTSKSIGY